MTDKQILIDNINEINNIIEKVKFETEKYGSVVLFTNGNDWYIPTLIHNLLLSMKIHEPLRKIIVFCSDKAGYNKCKELGFDYFEYVDIPDLMVNNVLSGSDASTKNYTRLSFVKIVLIKHILELGYTPLYLDPDMAFLTPAIDDLLSYLDHNDFVCAGTIGYINSNIMAVKPTDFNKKLFELTLSELNRVVYGAMTYGDEDMLRPRLLNNPFTCIDTQKYPPGCNAVACKDIASIIHSNCVIGLQNKIDLMKKCNAWFLTNKIDHMYISHYTKLTDRKKYMDEQLKKHKTSPVTWLTNFDREVITPSQIKKYIKHSNIHPALIANFIAHMNAIKDIADHYEIGMIVEDDSLFVEDFEERLQQCLDNLPYDWDIVFLGDGQDINGHPKFTPPNITPEKVLYKWNTARTASCYLIRNKCAKKILETAIPMTQQGIDHQLEYEIKNNKLESYLLIPALSYEGSQAKKFNSTIGWQNGCLPTTYDKIITKFTILGERCSGTNFLQKAITDNFDIDLTWEYGWKHFFGFSGYHNSDDTLFIGIVKNPYDWLNSLFTTPHHLPDVIKSDPVSFLTHEWYSLQNDYINELELDRNMHTNQRYNNIFQMRSVKTNYLLNMHKNVKNFVLITYENLKNNFGDTLASIQSKFNLSRKHGLYINLTTFNGKPVEKLDRSIINANLDMRVESLLGYQKNASLPLTNVCIDVGAHVGMFCTNIANKNSRQKIYAFEPLKSILPLLYEYTKQYPNIIVVPKAIDEKTGKAVFYEGINKETSSLLPFSKDGVQKWKSDGKLETSNSYQVETIRLDEFLSENNIIDVAVLKIDAQGHDLAVIRSLGSKISCVHEIIAEVQITDFKIYENSSSRSELVNYMESNNFYIAAENYQSYNQEANIVFIRKY